MAVSAKTTETPRKRRDHPPQTPQTTPSPQAKGVRLTEPPAQANEQQPTSNIQQPATNEQRKELESKEETPTDEANAQQPTSTRTSASNELMVTNKNKIDDYEFQQAIKAVGGRTILEDKHRKYYQGRFAYKDGRMVQVSLNYVVDHKGCYLLLHKWRDTKKQELFCHGCRQRTRRGEEDAYRGWYCRNHEYEQCCKCVPVVIRTEIIYEK